MDSIKAIEQLEKMFKKKCNRFNDYECESGQALLMAIKSLSWNNIETCKPPIDKPVLFKTKDGRQYVGKYLKMPNGKETYLCITARNSSVTGIKPISWKALID